jgi:hypothetical protein
MNEANGCKLIVLGFDVLIDCFICSTAVNLLILSPYHDE